FAAAFALALAIAPYAFAQDNSSNAPARASVAAGQKTKLTGVVVSRNSDSFVLQDASGAQTTVTINDRTSVKAKGSFLGGGKTYALSSITRGLTLEVEGAGDSTGNLVANDRINSLDDYTPEQSININFRARSAVLTPDAKASLDKVAQYAKDAKGYLIEVTGYAYESRDKNANRQLSQQRAESVVRYLVENHNIPLRRILTPFGYGAMNPVADNTTREGRTENRRAEVRVLVNRGLTNTPGDGTKVSAATPPQ